MIVLLLLIHCVFGDVYKDPQYEEPHVVNHTATCPDVGYFFKKNVNHNAIDPGCHLCFCQEAGSAICWPRENRRCDAKHYYHIGKKKRETRIRRSPGFADIFFRDATRDIFNRQSPEECKPFEASKSEGCPPADWCIGCTVCDCDANGRWNCHILSFCPNDKQKKQVKKRRGALRSKIVKRQTPTKKPQPKSKSKPTEKPNKKPPVKKNNKKLIKGKKPQVRNNKNKQAKGKQIKHNSKKAKKITPVKKPKTPAKTKKPPPKGKGKPSKKGVQKGKKSPPPKSGKKKREILDQNDTTVKFARTILKKVMASVEKIVNESQKPMNKPQGKIIQKRSMTKQLNQKQSKGNKKESNKIKKITMKKYSKKYGWDDTKKYYRRKRDTSSVHSQNIFYNESIPILTKRSDTTTHPRKSNNQFMLTILSPEKTINNTYFNYAVDSTPDPYINKINLLNMTIKDNNNYLAIDKSFDGENFKVKTNNKSSIIFYKNAVFANQTMENKVTQDEQNEFDNRTIKKSYYNNKTRPRITLLKHTKLLKKKINNIPLDDGNILNKNTTCGKMCRLKKIVREFIYDIGKRNVINSNQKNNKKKFNIITYLKKYFRILFRKNGMKSKNITSKEVYPSHKQSVIRTLCKNIDPCNWNPRDKRLLYKVERLSAESNKILKSITIIKGLLKLLDKDTKKSGYHIENDTGTDIIKLNSIIREKYIEDSRFTNLTESQLTQIKYIKDNTQVFINSVEKFAYLLNDIIKILTTNKNVSNSRRYLRCARKHELHNNIEKKNETIPQKLDRLQNLLINYNLVQNKFMKRMYDVLFSLKKSNVTTGIVNRTKELKLKNNNTNDTTAVETYMKNIIKNLRKLKNLAEKLSFKSRKKRAAMADDDAIEYLLMLMEYLIKQNTPLNVTPVNDGIDLLIEAIKNSPDIKPIKKKVLDYDTNEKENTMQVENNPDATRTSELYDTTPQLDLKQLIALESHDDDDSGDFNQNIKTRNKILESNLSNLNNHNPFESSTQKTYVHNDKDEVEQFNVIIDKFNNKERDNSRRYEIFNDETDEEESTTTRNRKSSVDIEMSTLSGEVTTTVVPKRTTIPNVNKSQEYVNELTSNETQRLKLDWIDETYNQEERKDFTEMTLITVTTTEVSKHRATRTSKPKKTTDKYSDPISSMSRELTDEDKKHDHTDSNIKKNILNSLDYEKEKSLVDSDSKEEKYNADPFPLYFV